MKILNSIPTTPILKNHQNQFDIFIFCGMMYEMLITDHKATCLYLSYFLFDFFICKHAVFKLMPSEDEKMINGSTLSK